MQYISVLPAAKRQGPTDCGIGGKVGTFQIQSSSKVVQKIVSHFFTQSLPKLYYVVWLMAHIKIAF